MFVQSGDIILKKYRLEDRLGLGGFSEVWSCVDTGTDELLAVKIFLKQDKEGMELCKEEYLKMWNLRHEHILRPYFFTTENEVPFFFMPYYKEGPVIKKKEQMSERELAILIKQIASALYYIHNFEGIGILHNDLKPDNILINKPDDYLLTDFGIGMRLSQKMRALDENEERRTEVLKQQQRTGITPMAYRAPELFKHKDIPKQDPVKASDIWAFAASIYQLATGRAPFESEGGQRQHIIRDYNPRATTEDMVAPLPAPFSKGFDRLLKRCLSFFPWERPSAEDLVKAANRFLERGNWEEQNKPEPIFYVSSMVLDFGRGKISEMQLLELNFTAAHMDGSLRLSVTHPFAISWDGCTFSSALTLALQNESFPKILYVHFTPINTARQKGVLTFARNEFRLHTVELMGQGVERLAYWKIGAATAATAIGAGALVVGLSRESGEGHVRTKIPSDTTTTKPIVTPKPMPIIPPVNQDLKERFKDKTTPVQIPDSKPQKEKVGDEGLDFDKLERDRKNKQGLDNSKNSNK